MPIADIQSRLFDDLVGSGEQRRRYGEPERFGGLEIDDHFVLDRRLHRQIGRLLTFEDTVDIIRRASERIDCRSPVGDQTAGLNKEGDYSRPWATGAGLRAR